DLTVAFRSGLRNRDWLKAEKIEIHPSASRSDNEGNNDGPSATTLKFGLMGTILLAPIVLTSLMFLDMRARNIQPKAANKTHFKPLDRPMRLYSTVRIDADQHYLTQWNSRIDATVQFAPYYYLEPVDTIRFTKT